MIHVKKWMGKRICDMDGHAQKPATSFNLIYRYNKREENSQNIKLHSLVCNAEIIYALEHMEKGKSFLFHIQRLK